MQIGCSHCSQCSRYPHAVSPTFAVLPSTFAYSNCTPRTPWLQAWSAFLRTRPPRRSLPTPSQLDAYIEEARRELLLQGGGWAGTGGESVLDRAMAFGEGQDWMEEEDWGLEDDGR